MDEINGGISIVKVLKQVTDAIKQNIELEFKEMKLTGSQGMLMGTLAHQGPMKISDLSERLGLSNSTVSGIVDRLEKQGFLERTRSEEDRRVVLVSVTAEFKKSAEKHFTEIEKQVNTIIHDATSEEIEKIFEGFSILKRLLDRQNDKDSGSES